MRAYLSLSVGILLLVATGSAHAADAMAWARSIDEAQQIATAQHKLVLIHFYDDENCPPCKALDANVFPRADFARGVGTNYVPVKINGQKDRKTAIKYGVDRWPVDVICTADGKPLTKPLLSPQDPNKYLSHLNQIAAQHRVQPGVNPAPEHVAANQASNLPPGPQQNIYAQAAHSTMQPDRGENPTQPVLPQQGGYDASAYAKRDAGSVYVEGGQHRPEVSNLPPRNAPAQPGLNQGPEANGDSRYAQDSVYGGQRRDEASQGQGQGQSRYGAPSDYRPNGNVAATQPPVEQPRPNVNVPPQQQPPQMQLNPNVTQRESQVQVSESMPRATRNPPLIYDGYCPVTLTEAMLAHDGKNAWKPGDVRFGAIHRGRTYLFVSEAAQAKFLANPDKYSPMLSGYDPVIFAERGELVDGSRNNGTSPDGWMYLFSSRENMEKFEKSPQLYTRPVQQAMMQHGGAPNMRR